MISAMVSEPIARASALASENAQSHSHAVDAGGLDSAAFRACMLWHSNAIGSHFYQPTIQSQRSPKVAHGFLPYRQGCRVTWLH